MQHTRAAAIAVMLGFVSQAPASLIQVNNTTFRDYTLALKNKAIPKIGTYVPPTGGQLTAFRALADALWVSDSDADLQALVAPAAALNYDVVKLTDNGVVYHGLREQLVNDAQTLGWGSYFVRQGERRDAMVQVPHPLADTNTWDVGAQAYVASEARGFLMAGAHRDAGGAPDDDNADVAHLTDSMFQEVHKSWNGVDHENIAWQVHGFNLDTHLQFPPDTDAVLSNGTGGVSPEIVALDAAIEALGLDWESYAYNTLNVNDPLNVAVNGNVVGTTFGGQDGLGATTNVQKNYSISSNPPGTFVHIELEQSFRLDNGAAGIPLAATAIANAISNTTPLIPEPAVLGSLGVTGITLGRRRAH